MQSCRDFDRTGQVQVRCRRGIGALLVMCSRDLGGAWVRHGARHCICRRGMDDADMSYEGVLYARYKQEMGGTYDEIQA